MAIPWSTPSLSTVYNSSEFSTFSDFVIACVACIALGIHAAAVCCRIFFHLRSQRKQINPLQRKTSSSSSSSTDLSSREEDSTHDEISDYERLLLTYFPGTGWDRLPSNVMTTIARFRHDLEIWDVLGRVCPQACYPILCNVHDLNHVNMKEFMSLKSHEPLVVLSAARLFPNVQSLQSHALQVLEGVGKWKGNKSTLSQVLEGIVMLSRSFVSPRDQSRVVIALGRVQQEYRSKSKEEDLRHLTLSGEAQDILMRLLDVVSDWMVEERRCKVLPVVELLDGIADGVRDLNDQVAHVLGDVDGRRFELQFVSSLLRLQSEHIRRLEFSFDLSEFQSQDIPSSTLLAALAVKLGTYLAGLGDFTDRFEVTECYPQKLSRLKQFIARSNEILEGRHSSDAFAERLSERCGMLPMALFEDHFSVEHFDTILDSILILSLIGA